MFVTLLQMMGFPLGMPVHSRAEGPGAPAPAPNAGNQTPLSKTPRVSVRRQKVNAKTKSATPAKAKATVEPVAKAAKSPASPLKPAATAKKANAVAAEEPKTAKTASKAAPAAVASKVSVAAKKSAATVVKPAKAPIVKTATTKVPAVKPLSKPISAKTPPVVADTKVKPPVQVIAPTPPAPTPAPVTNTIPVKSGRPSSRLAQLTVPSMAQSVASTAAKSSFNQASEPPTAVLVIPAIVKKDSKLANNWKTTPVEHLTDAELLAMPDSEYMNEVQMAAFRLKLTKLKRDILNSAGETTEHLREDTSVVPDPADRATIEEEHALELRTRDRERKLLKKIEQSIGRIDLGDYGYCDETGEAIGVGRLLARPTATLSLEAQQRRELKQKMFGD